MRLPPNKTSSRIASYSSNSFKNGGRGRLKRVPYSLTTSDNIGECDSRSWGIKTKKAPAHGRKPPQTRERSPGIGLQKFEDIGIDADRKNEVDRPGPQVQEPAQQVQGTQPMGLRQKNLKPALT